MKELSSSLFFSLPLCLFLSISLPLSLSLPLPKHITSIPSKQPLGVNEESSLRKSLKLKTHCNIWDKHSLYETSLNQVFCSRHSKASQRKMVFSFFSFFFPFPFPNHLTRSDNSDHSLFPFLNLHASLVDFIHSCAFNDYLCIDIVGSELTTEHQTSISNWYLLSLPESPKSFSKFAFQYWNFYLS